MLKADTAQYEGHFSDYAAHEPGFIVEAEIYRVEICGVPKVGAEIEALIWLPGDNPEQVLLAPLTQNCILPLIRAKTSSCFSSLKSPSDG